MGGPVNGLDDTAALESWLRRFGFSDREIDVYLAVCEHDGATTGVIADATGVSQRHVARLVEELEIRGFLVVQDQETPRTIRARSPEAALEVLQSDLEAIRENPAEPLSEALSGPFEVIKTHVTLLNRLRAVIENAEEEILVALPLSVFSEVEAELRDAVDRGIFVRLIVVNHDRHEVDPNDIEGLASVARAFDMDVGGITADWSRSIVTPIELLYRTTSSVSAMDVSEGPADWLFTDWLATRSWPMGAEVYVGDPFPLPATYDSFRHAVLHATLHYRAGTRIQVSVEGRSLSEGGRYETITGEIVEINQGLVEPGDNLFPTENNLTIWTGDRQVTIGGFMAVHEDYEARRTTLRNAAESD